MPTLFRHGEYRVVIFTNDHPPPHVHVVNDGYATIAVGTNIHSVRILEARGIPRPVVRAIIATIIDRRLMVYSAWKHIHGD